MIVSRELIETAELDKLTLAFKNPRLEAIYRQHHLPGLRLQSRIALLVGTMLYGLYSVMDYLFIPSSNFVVIFSIQIMVLILAVVTFLVTYSNRFIAFNQSLLGVLGFIGGLGLLWEMTYLDPVNFSFFYAGLIIIAFWCYNFSGLSFVYASLVSVLLLVLFNLMFKHLDFLTLFSYNFLILSANILGAFASYFGEKQSRMLFIREKELDAERQLQHERALHDRLTGLPNRELLYDRIEQAISFSARNDQLCAGLFLDLDQFKPINDAYGHAIGDAVLQEVTARFKQVLRETDTLARLGGDEFFVLANNIHAQDTAVGLAKKLLQKLEMPIEIPGVATIKNLSVSIGISLFPYKYATAEDIVRQADQSMYEIKRAGKAGISVAVNQWDLH
jgi:diguanylate cyclase (GGDEF)-like protein